MTRKHIELYAVVLSMVSILLASSFPSVSSPFPTTDTENGVRLPEGNGGEAATRAVEFDPEIVSDENTTRSAYPDEIVTFNCTVRNMGNIVDDYEVSSTHIRGWSIICDPYQISRIPPYSSPSPESDRVRELTVMVVVGDLYNATVDKYTFDVTVKSKLSPSNQSTLPFTINVKLQHIIKIIPPEGQYRLPGEDVLYEFTVQNLGNGDDEYDLWVESSDDEWVARLLDENHEILKIKQGRIVVIPVIVYLPEEVDVGHCQITTLCARPHSDPNASVTCGFVQTIVKGFPCKPFDMYIEVREKAGQLEDTLTFTVDVIIHKDYGKDKEGGITFLMSEQPSGWFVDIDDSNVPESGLMKDMEYEISVIVSIPHSTPVGQYNLTLDGYDNGPPMKFVDCVTFHVDVLPTYRAEMVFYESEKPGVEEENVSFSALLTNTGNIEDSFVWTLSGYNVSWVDRTHGGCTLAPGDTREITFNFLAPIQTPAGPYGFKFHLDSSNESSISFEHIFVLNVSARLDFEFIPTERVYYINPGEERFTDLEVMNTGNANVTIFFDVVGESWAFLTLQNLFIPYRGMGEISLRIVTAENTTPGVYSFQVVGRITTDPDTNRNVTVDIIIPTFEFTCSDIYIPDLIPGLAFTSYAGETVNFYVEIYNTGNQHFDPNDTGTNLSVMIRLGNELIHSSEIARLEAGSSVRVYFNHTFHTEGTFRLHAEINAERVLHESNYTNNDAAGEITILARGTDDTAGDQEDGDTFFGRKLSVLLAVVLIIFICSIIITGAVILIRKRYPPEL